MTNQIVLRRSSKPLQRQKMMIKENSTSSTALVPPPPSRSARWAEVAGGTAAECAAVCCCCPCGVVSFIVLAVVRLPAGLCRKAIKKRGRKKKTRSLQQPKRHEDEELRKDGLELDEISPGVSPGRWPDKSPAAVVSEMEEMWTKMYGTGFWRSPSEREH